MHAEPVPSGSRPRAALALVALGAVGIAALLPSLPRIDGVPAAVLLLNPALLLVAAAFAGAWWAPRVGFRSIVAAFFARRAGARGRIDLPVRSLAGAAMLGSALGLAIAGLDQLSASAWQMGTAARTVAEAWTLSAFVTGIGYGGIVEEIVMRWGLMSALVLAACTVARTRPRTPPAAIWAGILLSALIFAAGHLPLALGEGSSAAFVIRTLALNSLAGIAFGALFAYRSLEHAMAAHIGLHVGFAVFALAVLPVLSPGS